jgi:hypothetical protein
MNRHRQYTVLFFLSWSDLGDTNFEDDLSLFSFRRCGDDGDVVSVLGFCGLVHSEANESLTLFNDASDDESEGFNND